MQVGELLARLRLDSSGYQTGIRQAERSNQRFNRSIFNMSNMIKTALAGFTAKKLTDFFIGGNAQFEQYQITFEKLLGSTDAAKAKMEELANFAAHTPFQLEGVVEAGKLLEAYGLSTQKFLEDAGDLASAFNADISEVARALGRINAGDFGEAFERLRDFGISRKELEGQGLEFDGSGHYVGSVDDALTAVQKIIQEKFGGTMKAQSKSAKGMISTLIDNFKQFGRNAGEEAFEKVKGELEDLLKKVQELSKDGTLKKWAKDVGNAVSKAVDFLIAMGKAIFDIGKFIKNNKGEFTFFASFLAGTLISLKGYMIISKLIPIIYGLAGALQTSTLSFTALSTAMNISPIGLVITLVGGLITALVTLYKTNDTARYYMQQAWSVIKQTVMAAIGGILVALEALTKYIPGVGEKITALRKKLDNAFNSERATMAIRKNQREMRSIGAAYEEYGRKRREEDRKILYSTQRTNASIVQSHRDTTRKIKDTLDNRVDYIKDSADKWLDIEKDKIDHERDLLDEAYDNVRESLENQIDKVEENERRITDYYKDSYDKQIDALREKKDETIDILEEKRDRAIDAIKEEEEEELESIDRRIEKVREYYDEQIKSIDDIANRKIKALQDQIKALEKGNQQDNDTKFFEDKNKKLAEVEAKYNRYSVASTKEAQEKAKELYEQMTSIKEEIAQKQKDVEIRKQKESINEQIDAIKEQAQKEKDELKAKKDSRLKELQEEREYVKKHYKEELKDLKEKYDRELKETKKHYENMIKKKETQRDSLIELAKQIFENQKKNLNGRITNLEDYYKAEKQKLDEREYVIKQHHAQMEQVAETFAKNYKAIMNKSQEQVIQLLRSKKNRYYQSGKTLVQEFINGINAKKAALESKVREISSIVSDYMELHSPAKKGPLSKLDKFWQPFPKTLLKGLDSSLIEKNLSKALSVSGNISTLAGGGFSGFIRDIKIEITGDWAVDTTERKQEVVQDLSKELKTFFRSVGVK